MIIEHSEINQMCQTWGHLETVFDMIRVFGVAIKKRVVQGTTLKEE
jgi:hypothetical protein